MSAQNEALALMIEKDGLRKSTNAMTGSKQSFFL